MVVCLCQGVSDKSVQRAIDRGACSRRQVTEACGAGGVCGGCHSEIAEMIRECARKKSLAAGAARLIGGASEAPGLAAGAA
jgi:bacterioferritin-associated ferredoxin